MYTVYVQELTFKSYGKLVTLISMLLGFLVGVIALLGSIIGLPVHTSFLLISTEGIQAGLLSVILGPVVFSILGFIISIFSYLPFKLFIRLFKGVKIEGKFSQI